MRHTYVFLWFIFVFSTQLDAAGLPARDSVQTIQVLHADQWRMIRRAEQGSVQLLIGQVRAKHEETLFFCDSAYIYDANKDIEAFGNVLIELNDSVKIYADYLKYNASTRLAQLEQHIVLHDKAKRLYTDHMTYNRNTGLATYWQGGRLIDSSNVLRSQKAYYYSRSRWAEFKDDVVVETPEYTMFSDTLKYNTAHKLVRFLGSTTITGDSTYAYAEKGFFNQKNKDLILQYRAELHRRHNQIKGDSLYVNDSLGLAKGQGHIKLSDTAQNIAIYGGLVYYNKAEQRAWITDRAYAQHNAAEDTLYMHADTLSLYFDSLQVAKHLEAYAAMRFYSRSMQAVADSLCYQMRDSTLQLYRQVFLWNKDNQISCDWADIFMRNKQIDSAVFHDNVLIASQDTIDTNYYNQMQANQMRAWFKHNEINKLSLEGQVKTNYFVWEEDDTPVGMFYVESQSMNIWLRNRKIQMATYYTKPKNITFPLDQLPPEKAQLPGFQWKAEWRPKHKLDIFRKP